MTSSPVVIVNIVPTSLCLAATCLVGLLKVIFGIKILSGRRQYWPDDSCFQDNFAARLTVSIFLTCGCLSAIALLQSNQLSFEVSTALGKLHANTKYPNNNFPVAFSSHPIITNNEIRNQSEGSGPEIPKPALISKDGNPDNPKQSINVQVEGSRPEIPKPALISKGGNPDNPKQSINVQPNMPMAKVLKAVIIPSDEGMQSDEFGDNTDAMTLIKQYKSVRTDNDNQRLQYVSPGG